MENIYKNNLLILGNIQNDETIYYYENQILKEDRYFGSVRSGNNIDKILNIINISFLHYYNILLIDNLEKDLETIKPLLKNSIIGLEKFKNYNKSNNINTDKIENLIIQLTHYLLELENNNLIKNKKSRKIIQDTIDLPEDNLSLENIDLCNDNIVDIDNVFLPSEEKKTDCNIVYKVIYGIRNTISGFFISIYNHIFVY